MALVPAVDKILTRSMDARCPNLCSNTWTMSFYLGRSVDLVNSTPVCVREPGEPEMIRRRQVTVNVVNYLHHVTIVMSGITIAINTQYKTAVFG